MLQLLLNFRQDTSTQSRLRLSSLLLIGLLSAFFVGMISPQFAYAQGICADTEITGVEQAECETLVAFYTSTNGSSWTTSTNWNTSTAVASWYGVTVSGTHVTELVMKMNNLSGPLPDLSALTYLQKLSLDFSYLTGEIPDLSALTQLQYLNLGVNQLSGNIPDLSILPQLRHLNLLLNNLDGDLSEVSMLTQLQYLSLGYNNLTGNLSDVAGLTQVTELWLNNNQLTGSIPDLSAFTQLQKLYLSGNQLVSMVPPSIMNTAIGTTNSLRLCGGNNIIASTDPAVTTWVVARHPTWTQGCGSGTAPVAVADADYTTPVNTALTIAAPGVLTNDSPGTPTGTITFFGGGSLGGVVTDHVAGTTTSPLPSYSTGSLQVNANGSFAFTPPTGFSGAYTFQYRLDNGVGTSDATVTIQIIPTLRVSNGSGFESNTTITFTVTRTGRGGTSTVHYSAANGTATAGSDYVAVSGTLTFNDGVATQQIEVPMISDQVVEINETFTITLSNPTNATITDNSGLGTITNSTVKLNQPENNSFTKDNTPTFTWAAILGAAEYRLQVDNDIDFSSPVVNVLVTSLNYTPTALSDGTYYWRVRARNAADNWGAYCTEWTFTIDTIPPDLPVRVTPRNGTTIADNTPTFLWYASSGAVNYQLLVDDSFDMASPLINVTQVARTYTPTTALANRLYYWQVRAQDEAGNWSGWGNRWSFTVNTAPFIQPTLIPTNTPRPTRTPQPTLVPTSVPTATPTNVPTEVAPLLQTVESDQPIVVQSGTWAAYDDPTASGSRYLLSSTPADALTMAFSGSEVTVVYIKHPAVGSFAVEVDGVLQQIVDSVATEAVFGAKITIGGLVYGQHTVRVYPVAGIVAIDAFQVETALEIIVPTETPVPTDMPTGTPVPTEAPTETPVPTDVPTDVPTAIPTETPVPTDMPTGTPVPTDIPTEVPTETPVPTDVPTEAPDEVLPPEATEEPAS